MDWKEIFQEIKEKEQEKIKKEYIESLNKQQSVLGRFKEGFRYGGKADSKEFKKIIKKKFSEKFHQHPWTEDEIILELKKLERELAFRYGRDVTQSSFGEALIHNFAIKGGDFGYWDDKELIEFTEFLNLKLQRLKQNPILNKDEFIRSKVMEFLKDETTDQTITSYLVNDKGFSKEKAEDFLSRARFEYNKKLHKKL